MKGKFIGVMLALAVMAGSMALAQTHKDRDHDRDNAKVKKMVTKIHSRAGSKTITIVKKQKGDNDKDKDDKGGKKVVTKRTVKKVWTQGKKPVRKTTVVTFQRKSHRGDAAFQRRLRRYRASWHHKRVVRKTVIVHRRVVHHNRGRHRGWWIGKGNRKHNHKK